MKRNGLIVALVAFVALTAAAVVLAGCGGSRLEELGPERRLAGVPAGHDRPQREARGRAGRRLAGAGNRHRQPAHADQLPRRCRRRGSAWSRSSVSSSGAHAGRLRGLLAGRRRELRARQAVRRRRAGARARRDRPDVGAARRAPAGRQVSFGFRVDTPYPTAHVPAYPNPPASPADYESFDTLPGVQAPILTVTTPDRDPAAGDIFTTNGPGPGAVRAADLHAAGPARVVRPALGRAHRRGPERAELRRPARPDLVAGARCSRSASARAKTSS